MATFYSSYNNGYRITVTTSYGNQNRSTMTSTLYWTAKISGSSSNRTATGSLNLGGSYHSFGFSSSGSTTLYHNKTTGYGNFSVSASASVMDNSSQTQVATLSLSGTTTDVPTIVPYTAPSASASVSNITRNSVTLSWSSNATINYWWYSLNNGSWVEAGNPNASSGSRSITGLSAGTAYTLKVRLRKADGNLTTDSSNASFTTDSLAAASAPAISNIERDRLTASFTPNKTIKYYRFLVNGAYSGNQVDVGTPSSAARSGVLTGLSPSTSYNISVRLWDGVHTGSYTTTPVKAATTAAIAAVNTPTSSAITRNSFSIGFTTTASMSGFQYSLDNGATWSAKQSGSGTSGAFSVSGLNPGTTYNVRVRAYDGVHTGTLSAASANKAVVTDTIATAAVPTSSNITRDSFSVSFTANKSISAYQLVIDGAPYGNQVNSSTIAPINVTGRSGGKAYSVAVRVWDGVHTSNYTTGSPATITTTALAQPNTLTLLGRTAKTLSISWTSSQTAIAAQYSTDDGLTWKDANTFSEAANGSFTISELSHSTATLQPGTNYIIYVRLKDAVHTTLWGDSSLGAGFATYGLSSSIGTTFNIGGSVDAIVTEAHPMMYHDITLQYYNTLTDSWITVEEKTNLNAGATFTTAEAREAAEKSSPNSNDVPFRFLTTSKWDSGGDVQGVHVGTSFIGKITDANPTISNVRYQDIHPIQDIIDIKGGNQFILRNISPVEITIDGASAIKGAKLTKYTVKITGSTHSSNSIDGLVTANDVTMNIGTVNSPLDEIAEVTVYDSRGNSTPFKVTLSVVDYSAPELINLQGERKFSYEESTYLNLLVRYHSLKSGSIDNNLITGQVRYTEIGTTNYTPWVSFDMKETYRTEPWQYATGWDPFTEFTPGILGKPSIGWLDSNRTYVVQIRFMDEITRIVENVDVTSDLNTNKMYTSSTDVGMGVGMVEKYIDRWEFGVDIKDRDTGLKYLHAGDVQSIADIIYPVGSIYTSVNSTNPQLLFGGTWAAFGAGRMLVGVNASDTDFNTVEKTGGSKTNTLDVANIPSHTHTFSNGTAASAGEHTHTVTGTVDSGGTHTHSVSGTAASDGAHTHPQHPDTWMNRTAADGYVPASGTFVAQAQRATYYTGSAGAHTHTVSGTAANAGAHSHTFSSGSAAKAGAHTHTVTGTISSTGSGTAFNTVDPYITVYMWKRTA